MDLTGVGVAFAGAAIVIAAVLIGPTSAERKDRLYLCSVSVIVDDFRSVARVTVRPDFESDELKQVGLEVFADRLDALHPPRHSDDRQVQVAMRVVPRISELIRDGDAEFWVFIWDALETGELFITGHPWMPKGDLPSPDECR